jgi:outer membrane protein assembly factor BamB
MKRKNRPFILLLLAIISLRGASAFAAAPTISVFAPASGVLYSTVTITGTNFVAPVTVSFNGVASTSVTLVSSTSLKATLPPTASTGVISVGAAGGSASSASAFTVLPGMLVSPAVGPPTTVTRIYYSGFSAYEPVDIYFDTGDIAIGSASSGGAGNLPVTIPAAGRPGVHFVTAVGRRSLNSAQGNFTVQTSWPQVGFAPNHKAKNRYENVLSAANVTDLDEAWRTPQIGSVYCTPAIVNGIVYCAFGDGTIRAFDETTGAQKWSCATGGNAGMYSSPAVSNGIVYAGSTDSYLYALDAVTGTLKWRYQTGGLVLSSPNVVNGIVYFGSYDSKIYALNATTGALIWTYTTGSSVFSSPMIANGVLYVGSFDNKVYALNAATGAMFWSFATAGEVFSSPTIAGGLVWIGSQDNSMYALDASSGAVIVEFDSGAEINSSAAAVGGAIIFGNDSGTVYCLSPGGATLWSTPLPNTPGDIFSQVCVANGVVYIRDAAYTYALDQHTGAVLTTLRVGESYGGAAVVNGAVFGGDLDDNVLTRYTPNALQSGYVAPRPDPMQLWRHHLR